MSDEPLDMTDPNPKPATAQDVMEFEDRLDVRDLNTLSKIENDAFQEGYDKGYDQGMEDGYNEAKYGEQFHPVAEPSPLIPKISMCAPRANERYENSMRLMAIAQRMAEVGFRVDHAAIERHYNSARDRAAHFSALFLKLTGLPADALGKMGFGGTTLVRDHFFKTLHAPEVEVNKVTGRPQCNTAALTTWATSYKTKEFAAPAAALIGLRKNKKAMDFCTSYRTHAEHDGRVHFSFNVLGAVTGRWTSSARKRVVLPNGERKTYSVNAQQIPARVPEFDFGHGKEPLVESLRDIFIADEGCVLLKSDYDQLELRLIAYTYAVKALIKCIESGKDAHIYTAAHLFKSMCLDPNAPKPSKADIARDPRLKMLAEARDAAKPCAYAVSYQMHDPDGEGRYIQLTKTLKATFPDITEEKVAQIADAFFETYPEIKQGQLAVKQAVDRLGYRELPINGLRLYYPSTMRGYNQALNFGNQGTGAALVDRALLELDPQLDWARGEQVRVQCHDELLAQAPYKSADRIAYALENAMGRDAQIGASYVGIPAAADPGLDWGSCKSWEEFCKQFQGLLPDRPRR